VLGVGFGVLIYDVFFCLIPILKDYFG